MERKTLTLPKDIVDELEILKEELKPERGRKKVYYGELLAKMIEVYKKNGGGSA